MMDGTVKGYESYSQSRSETANTDVFHAVYKRNIRRVYRLCYLKLGHREDAEDAAQNVFLRWMKTGRSFTSEEHEKAYFLRAAINECLNQQTSYRRRMQCDMEDLSDAALSVSEEEAFAGCAVFDGAQELLQNLPALYREVLYLHYCEDLPTKTIAQMLARRESTVRTQLQVGRERLRKLLEEESK